MIGIPVDYPEFAADYANGVWEPETREIVDRYIGPGDLLVDIGAWIGPVARWALDRGGRVVAYEPDPVAYEALVVNCPEADCVPAAVDVTARDTVLHNTHWGDSTSRMWTGGWGDTIPIRTVAVSTVLTGIDPALVKIDIEGWESMIIGEVLRHARCPVWVAWHEPWSPRPFAELRDELARPAAETAWHADGAWGGWNHTLFTPMQEGT